LQALADLQERKPFELYGYCLMTNHFQLLIKPLEDNISRIMQSLTVSHTQRYHKHHGSGGHVWQGRFKSPVIQADDHLLTVLRYIEANPLRASMVRQAKNYRWSSFAFRGLGTANALLTSCVPYQQMAKQAKTRQRRWTAYVHQAPAEQELAAIRRSSARSLPYGSATETAPWRLNSGHGGD
jgi:putative transposase